MKKKREGERLATPSPPCFGMKNFQKWISMVGWVIGPLLWIGCQSIPSIPTQKNIPFEAFNLPLPIPNNLLDRKALGLEETKRSSLFTLNELKVDFLVIEVFDMYCHICQSSAQNLNTLSEALTANQPNSHFLMLGLGKENTQFEVDTFRENLNVRFPMIPDLEGKFAKSLAVQRTPMVMVLGRSPEGLEIIAKREGYFSKDNVQEFLNQISQFQSNGY